MPLPKRAIAASFLPDRYRYYYSLSKLAMDPLYEAVPGAFAEQAEPLLDLGCGIGLLLHCLRATGRKVPYIGVDTDAGKIAAARAAILRGGHDDAEFQVCDLSIQFPKHQGSVALLDVLQYLPRPAQGTLLSQAAQCVSKRGELVIRTGLADGTWRSAMTRATDRWSHRVGWMQTSFKAQPSAQELRAVMQRHGLQADFKPLWGRTPFNNWLVIARRPVSVAA